MIDSISITNLRKVFNNSVILSSVSFNIKRGECVAIIGKNGAGKSTICNIMSRLIRQDEGSFKIDNVEITDQHLLWGKKIRFLLSHEYLIKELSINDYLMALGKLMGLNKKYLTTRIPYLIKFLEIGDSTMEIGELSSGNKMLVKIAFMLLNEPEVIVLDEPFINLDLHYKNKIHELLLSLNKEGKTIIMITHYPEEVFSIAQRVLILDDGEIIQDLLISEYIDYKHFFDRVSSFINPKEYD